MLSVIEEQRAFAVIRTDSAAQAVDAGRACLRGGIHLLEITLTVPDALSAIRRWPTSPTPWSGWDR